MNKKRNLYIAKLMFAIFMVGQLTACVNNDRDAEQPSSSTNFDDVAMMINIADKVMISGYQNAKTSFAKMAGDAGDIESYCVAIGTANESNALITAQNQWKQAMYEWQQAELWTLGPAAANGASLRNLIYAFGANARLSSCGADQATVLAQQENFNIATRAVNHRGLLALEYLLFNTDLQHTCPTQVVETQDWNARTAVQRKQWRCEYARYVADDALDSINELILAWHAEGGNYRTTFLNPQNYARSLNDLSDALFYLDTEIKDLKLGLPLSMGDDCAQVNCADQVESIYSRVSLQNLRSNLIGFRRVFTGDDGLGFDDLINSKGFSDVSVDMLADIDAAIAALDGVILSAGTGGLRDLAAQITTLDDAAACSNAASNPSVASVLPICSVYGLVKRISDHLKTDFVTIVNLNLPDRAQSDND